MPDIQVSLLWTEPNESCLNPLSLSLSLFLSLSRTFTFRSVPFLIFSAKTAPPLSLFHLAEPFTLTHTLSLSLSRSLSGVLFLQLLSLQTFRLLQRLSSRPSSNLLLLILRRLVFPRLVFHRKHEKNVQTNGPFFKNAPR